MAMRPDTSRTDSAQPQNPIDYSQMCWRLHRALMLAQRDEPLLSADPLFHIFVAEAYERFDRDQRGDD